MLAANPTDPDARRRLRPSREVAFLQQVLGLCTKQHHEYASVPELADGARPLALVTDQTAGADADIEVCGVWCPCVCIHASSSVPHHLYIARSSLAPLT